MGLGDIYEDAIGFISEQPVTSALVGAGVGTAIGTGIVLASSSGSTKKRSTKSKRTRKTGRKIKHTKRGWKQDRARRSKQKWEVAYQKRKKKLAKKKKKKRSATTSRKSSKKIYYARKTGQPYILLASGKAKFIKGKRRKTR